MIAEVSADAATGNEVIDRLGDVLRTADEVECGEQFLCLLAPGLAVEVLAQIPIGTHVVIDRDLGVCSCGQQEDRRDETGTVAPSLAADHNRSGCPADCAQHLRNVRDSSVQHAAVVIAERGSAIDQVVQGFDLLTRLHIHFHERFVHVPPCRRQVIPAFLFQLTAGAQIEPGQLIRALREFSGGGMAERRRPIQPVVRRDVGAEMR